MNQDLWFRLLCKAEVLSEDNVVLSILRKVDFRKWSTPVVLQVTGKRDKKIEGFLDSNVLKALDKKKHSVILNSENESLSLSFHYHNDAIIVLRIAESLLRELTKEEINSLFMDLSLLVKPIYGEAHIVDHSILMNENYYSKSRRTYYCRGLHWLNFFSPEEEERQGGNLDQNPFITRAERSAEGLFIQVGEAPFDSLTPEGEELLVKATEAMPKAVRWSDIVEE